jgi:predicted nucleic acid-binding protein
VADLLVDTDVCIDHLEGIRRLPRAGRLAYSVITRAELLAGGPSYEAAVRRLLAGMDELVVDRRVAERAGELRRLGLRMPDALIAATGLVHQLTVLTRNVAHFQRTPGLRLRSR